ncbi:MAG: hypothetical protein ACE5FZ_08780 [Nitrospiria bacterium]
MRWKSLSIIVRKRMNTQQKIIVSLFSPVLIGIAISTHVATAAEMSHQMKPKMDHQPHMMHQMKKKETGPSPGVKEIKIDLKGPFCHRHPEEIQTALIKLPGVRAVEAFSGRRYILVHYKGDQAAPEEMAKVVDGLGGSGWHCRAVLAKR